jgi:hypothetical protein
MAPIWGARLSSRRSRYGRQARKTGLVHDHGQTIEPGVTLIELSGNIVGRGCNVPGDLDRKSAPEVIASAVAALDRCAQI